MIVSEALVKPFYEGVKSGTMELKDILNSMSLDLDISDDAIAEYQAGIRDGSVSLEDIVKDINGGFSTDTPPTDSKAPAPKGDKTKCALVTLGIGVGSAALGTALGFFVGKRVSKK